MFFIELFLVLPQGGIVVANNTASSPVGNAPTVQGGTPVTPLGSNIDSSHYQVDERPLTGG